MTHKRSNWYFKNLSLQQLQSKVEEINTKLNILREQLNSVVPSSKEEKNAIQQYSSLDQEKSALIQEINEKQNAPKDKI